jgi:hypothetical protein
MFSCLIFVLREWITIDGKHLIFWDKWKHFTNALSLRKKIR